VTAFTIRESWRRHIERIPNEEGISLSLPFVEFEGRVLEDERPILALFLAGAENIRFNTRPCCEACADMSAKSFRRIESLGRLALRALPSHRQMGAARILLGALVSACEDYRTYIRNSPVPILPVPYQLGWDEELRVLCLDTVKTLSIHLTAVIDELKALNDAELPTRHHRQLTEWPEGAYIVDDRR
jgi:hypothetical protein